jgi:hypothetical protein
MGSYGFDEKENFKRSIKHYSITFDGGKFLFACFGGCGKALFYSIHVRLGEGRKDHHRGLLG